MLHLQLPVLTKYNEFKCIVKNILQCYFKKVGSVLIITVIITKLGFIQSLFDIFDTITSNEKKSSYPTVRASWRFLFWSLHDSDRIHRLINMTICTTKTTCLVKIKSVIYKAIALYRCCRMCHVRFSMIWVGLHLLNRQF